MCQASRTSSCGRLRGDLDQRLRLAGDTHDRAVVEHEPVAVAQHHRPAAVEQELGAPLAGEHDAPAMALVGIEHDAVDDAAAARVPRSPSIGYSLPDHRRKFQRQRLAP